MALEASRRLAPKMGFPVSGGSGPEACELEVPLWLWDGLALLLPVVLAAMSCSTATCEVTSQTPDLIRCSRTNEWTQAHCAIAEVGTMPGQPRWLADVHPICSIGFAENIRKPTAPAGQTSDTESQSAESRAHRQRSSQISCAFCVQQRTMPEHLPFHMES